MFGNHLFTYLIYHNTPFQVKNSKIFSTLQIWSYQTHNSDSVFTIFPKVHLQRPPDHHFRRKIQHFFGEGTDKNTTQKSPKHAISSNLYWEVAGRGIVSSPDPSFGEEGYPLPTPHPSPSRPNFLDLRVRSQNSSRRLRSGS